MEITIDSTAITLSILSVLALAVIIGVGMFLAMLGRKKNGALGISPQEVRTRWAQIEDMVRRKEDMSMKLAILEADKLLDHALKSMHMGGATLGERLKLAVYKYPNLRNVWPAHIVRNNIAHEANYHLSPATAERAIRQFHDALKTLRVL